MADDCLSDEHYKLLLLSLQYEQDQTKSWNDKHVIDCGLKGGDDDNSTCMWNSVLCWYIYIYGDMYTDIYNFSTFKKLFYTDDPKKMPFQKCATPDDIQRIVDTLNIKIKVMEVDGERLYTPEKEDIFTSSRICTLILFDGHYQLLTEHDRQAEHVKNMIKSEYWNILISS